MYGENEATKPTPTPKPEPEPEPENIEPVPEPEPEPEPIVQEPTGMLNIFPEEDTSLSNLAIFPE